jgi:hypothetical protein
MQDARAGIGMRPPPAGKRPLGGVDRSVDVHGVSPGRANGLAGRRIVDDEPLAVLPRPPASVNEEV